MEYRIEKMSEMLERLNKKIHAVANEKIPEIRRETFSYSLCDSTFYQHCNTKHSLSEYGQLEEFTLDYECDTPFIGAQLYECGDLVITVYNPGFGHNYNKLDYIRESLLVKDFCSPYKVEQLARYFIYIEENYPSNHSHLYNLDRLIELIDNSFENGEFVGYIREPAPGKSTEMYTFYPEEISHKDEITMQTLPQTLIFQISGYNKEYFNVCKSLGVDEKSSFGYLYTFKDGEDHLQVEANYCAEFLKYGFVVNTFHKEVFEAVVNNDIQPLLDKRIEVPKNKDYFEVVTPYDDYKKFKKVVMDGVIADNVNFRLRIRFSDYNIVKSFCDDFGYTLSEDAERKILELEEQDSEQLNRCKTSAIIRTTKAAPETVTVASELMDD